LAGRCVGDLEKLRLINAPDVSAYRVARIRDFYPIYETGYKEKLGRFFRRINGIGNIVCAGRLGLASYNNIDHCLDMGIYLAESLAQGKGAPSINEDLLRRAGSYRIVD
jgi:protoporphyrinogen oxidase